VTNRIYCRALSAIPLLRERIFAIVVTNYPFSDGLRIPSALGARDWRAVSVRGQSRAFGVSLHTTNPADKRPCPEISSVQVEIPGPRDDYMQPQATIQDLSESGCRRAQP